jgi:tetratricopeptide (TPR) repeat protein
MLDEWIRHAWVEVERVPEDREAAIEVAVTAAHGRSMGTEDELAAEGLAFAAAVVGDIEPTDGIYVAFLLLDLSAGWRAVEEPEAAMAWARQVEVLLDGVAEPDHPLRWHAAAEVGRSLYWLDRCDEAVPIFDRALAGFAWTGDERDDADEAALVRGLLAECLHELGRLDVAIAEHRRALAYWETARPEIVVPRQRNHLGIARIMAELGRTAEAEQEYEHVLAVVDPSAPDNTTRRYAREELAALRQGG